ncbi:MAG: NAD(P)-dependent glycerol-3-phosphate dehydrogenase, partial [Planctomycetota bacterium]|nr:NAD(P)-dependent glycerol-3-phosphate dehydrogenase [Planctomycetota bacterium]
MRKVVIVGDGAWGTALALVLERSGQEVVIWGHDPGYLEEMRQHRENRVFLPGVKLPAGIAFADDLGQAVADAGLVVNAIPSRFLRPVFSRPLPNLPPGTPVVSLTKGLEPETLKRPSEVLADCLGEVRLAALSGPSHAEEVARGLPASLVSASSDLATARQVQQMFSQPRFRVYASADLVGVEIAAAAKNVIALAAGIVQGLELGDNALAALATRGMTEIARIGVAMGGDPRTFSGLAGIGDLITT